MGKLASKTRRTTDTPTKPVAALRVDAPTPVRVDTPVVPSPVTENTLGDGALHISADNRPEFPSEGRIRELAYQKWESAGCPCNDGTEHWYEAVRELLPAGGN